MNVADSRGYVTVFNGVRHGDYRLVYTLLVFLIGLNGPKNNHIARTCAARNTHG